MAVAVDTIRRLTRACIGARVYQGLLFWFVLAHNITAMLADVGYANPRVTIGLTLGAVVAAATMGTYCQWRFGRVEPPTRPLRHQVVRGMAFAVLLIVVLLASVVVVRDLGASPKDLIWPLLSAGTLWSLATSRNERLGWVVPLLASLGVLVTVMVPVLQPYRVVAHAGMAAALVVTAVQLHLFLVRGLRHAHV